MHPTPLYHYALTLLLACSSSTLIAASPIPQSPLPNSPSTSSSIFTSHFHSLLSTRDSPHAALLSSTHNKALQQSSNLLPRAAAPDPNPSSLYPSLHEEEEEDEQAGTSSSPAPSRSLDTTFRSPRLDGRQRKLSKGGWLSWVAAAPRGVRGLSGGAAGEEERWRAWEGVDHSI